MVAMSYFCRQNVSQISLEIVANCLHPSEILALVIAKFKYLTFDPLGGVKGGGVKL